MTIIYGRDKYILAWAREVYGFEFHPPCVTIGIAKDGELIGAVVFNNYTGPDIEASVMGEPRAFTPTVIRTCFRYAFQTSGCVRATLRTRKKNRKARELIERMGFRQEGCLKRYYGNDDAVIYGLLKEQAARWMR